MVCIYCLRSKTDCICIHNVAYTYTLKVIYTGPVEIAALFAVVVIPCSNVWPPPPAAMPLSYCRLPGTDTNNKV